MDSLLSVDILTLSSDFVYIVGIVTIFLAIFITISEVVILLVSLGNHIVGNNNVVDNNQIESSESQKLRCAYCTKFLCSSPTFIGSKGTNMCGDCYSTCDTNSEETFYIKVNQIESSELQKLRCFYCTKFLCSSPTIIGSKGTSMCKDCYSTCDINSDETFYKNDMYQIAAQHLVFPCSYAELGCRATWKYGVKWSDHEDLCPFNPKKYWQSMKCWECGWHGHFKQFVQHYVYDHEDRTFSNPYVGKPNIDTENTSMCLIKAFGYHFKLQVRYSSGTINHDVAFLGPSALAELFKFSLVLTCGRARISETKRVRDIYSAANHTVNTLQGLTILGDYQDINIELSILMEDKQCDRCKIVLNKAPIFVLEGLYSCQQCQLEKTRPRRERIQCTRTEKGCRFKSLSIVSIRKHEDWFCLYTGVLCRLCLLPVTGTWFKHIVEQHSTFVESYPKKLTVYGGEQRQRYSFLYDGIPFVCLLFRDGNEYDIELTCDTRVPGHLDYLCRYNITTRGRVSKYFKFEPVYDEHAWCDWYGNFILKPNHTATISIELGKKNNK